LIATLGEQGQFQKMCVIHENISITKPMILSTSGQEFSNKCLTIRPEGYVGQWGGYATPPKVKNQNTWFAYNYTKHTEC
jgi:hypothetical protein